MYVWTCFNRCIWDYLNCLLGLGLGSGLRKLEYNGLGLGCFLGWAQQKIGSIGGRLLCGYVLVRTNDQVWDFLFQIVCWDWDWG